MDYITSDEVMQVEMQDIKNKISKISKTVDYLERKDRNMTTILTALSKVNMHIKDVDFVIGKCYEILINETIMNAIFLQRVKNKLYFVTNGTGMIAIIERGDHFRDGVIEDSVVNNAAVLVIDLDLVDDSVYARELV